MVKYSCDVCKKNYSSLEEAEDCEEKGVVYGDIKPGLLFSHNKVEDGFLAVYGPVRNEGHEKMYHVEEFAIWDHVVAPVDNYLMPGSKINNLEFYTLSSDTEVSRVNTFIKDNFPGISLVKSYMERYGVEKLHNNLS